MTFDNCEKISRCKERNSYYLKSNLSRQAQWDSGKMWFKEVSHLPSQWHIPRSPTVIKWVNDWIKLLMVGWARWPLRSCQVSISRIRFCKSNTHGALWIWPPRKLRSQQNVSFLSLFSTSSFLPSLSSLLPGSHHSQGYLWVSMPQRKSLINEFRRRQGKVTFDSAGSWTVGCVIWQFVI